MLQVKFPVVNSIHPQSNKFASGVENKVTGVSKLKVYMTDFVYLLVYLLEISPMH